MSSSQWKDLTHWIHRDKLCRTGVLILFFFLAMAIASPLYIAVNPSLYNPLTGSDPSILGSSPPSWHHWLGTDSFGRDLFSQLLEGAQIAFLVGITSALLSVLLGVLVGLLAGFYGGFVDALLMRLTDIMLTLPGLPLLIVLGAVVKQQSLWILIFLIALFGWAGVARVVRSQALSLKSRGYVELAVIGGVPHRVILFRHLLPSILPLASLYIAFGVSGAIATEAALSFLGLGDASRTSWGMMLQWAVTTEHQFRAPYWVLPPGLCITLLSLAFYLIGKGLEQHFMPKLKLHA